MVMEYEELGTIKNISASLFAQARNANLFPRRRTSFGLVLTPRTHRGCTSLPRNNDASLVTIAATQSIRMKFWKKGSPVEFHFIIFQGSWSNTSCYKLFTLQSYKLRKWKKKKTIKQTQLHANVIVLEQTKFAEAKYWNLHCISFIVRWYHRFSFGRFILPALWSNRGS